MAGMDLLHFLGNEHTSTQQHILTPYPFLYERPASFFSYHLLAV